MRVLIVGTGGVGESVAVLAARRDPAGELFERVVLADADLARAQRVSRRLGEERFPAEPVDGADADAVAALATRHDVDVVCNFLPLWANVHVMEGAIRAGTHYLDTAFGVDPEPLPDGTERPWFDSFQFDYDARFEGIGKLALLGQGVEPGMVDWFARYAADHFFDEVEEMGVRDGSNLAIPGFEGIAFGFSVWSTIDELTCPAIVWEDGKGIFEVEPFSDREPFFFPEGIGTVAVSNVAHDEVVHISRNAGLLKGVRRATFKYGLGDEFEAAMDVLKSLNLHGVEPARVAAADGRHVMVAPRDLVAAVSPDPAEIGKRFVGRTAAGLWVKGARGGLSRELYFYQVADNQECVETFGTQAVVCQTAFTPVITLELLATGRLVGCGGDLAAGVHSPEEFAAEPYISLMDEYGFPGGVTEMDSAYKRAHERRTLTDPAGRGVATG